MKVLLVGSGGREHALAWALARSGRLDRAARRARQPGNRRARHAAIRRGPTTRRRSSRSPPSFASTSSSSARRRRSSPGSRTSCGTAASRSSAPARKRRRSRARRRSRRTSWRRRACRRRGRSRSRGRRASSRRTASPRARASGSAARRTELDAGLRAAEALGQPFHVEELLEGEEVSIFALCDGVTALPLPAAQDYKRDRRQRRGREHRRHGLVLAGAAALGRRRRGARRARVHADPRRARPAADRRSSACSSPG